MKTLEVVKISLKVFTHFKGHLYEVNLRFGNRKETAKQIHVIYLFQ